jgi:hypothetical protein
MKRERFNLLPAVAFIAFLMLAYSCKKDNTTSTSGLTGVQTEQVQNSDAQDALADKTDQDVDKTVDELQANNYKDTVITTNKSASVSGSIDIKVDHPDSTTFPKEITITYTNFKDSTADESFIKNGVIVITVSLADKSKPLLITRSHTFNNFSIITDSTSITINGNRTLSRTEANYKISLLNKGVKSMNLNVTDAITADLHFKLSIGSVTDSFSRVVSKKRVSAFHYVNTRYAAGDLHPWKHIKFKNEIGQDTVTYTGSITGINEKGDTYTKTITSPLVITYKNGSAVISSGAIAYTSGTASYSITFAADLPNHPAKTLVTVTNNTTGKVIKFDRKLSKRFTKWW